MGLLQAGMGAVGGVLGDQWKEYIYCDSLPPNVLMAKGHRKTGSGILLSMIFKIVHFPPPVISGSRRQHCLGDRT